MPYKTIEDGDFYKFEKKGESVEGLIVDYREIGRGWNYTMEEEKLGTIILPSHEILNRKLKRAGGVGQKVKVTFDDETKTEGGNRLLLYTVEVWEEEDDDFPPT